MTTSWYYDYYEPGTFPHQQELCEAVASTPYNLEGAQEISPGHLTRTLNNPLTLRLRALQRVLNWLEGEINHINAEIKETVYAQLNEAQEFGFSIRIHAQDSRLETGGAPVEEISFTANKTIRFHYDKVYFALYDFFTNLGSILDRLACEINLLYELGDWIEERIEWFRLVNQRNRFLCCLNHKDKS